MTDSGAARQRSDARANREAILDAARRTLALDPGASLGAVALSAGLSRRSVYTHFADRETLVREVIATGAVRFNAAAEAVLDTDPRLALARLAGALWAEAAYVRASAAIALDAAHVHDTAAALAPLRRRVADLAAAGQRLGVLRADVPATDLARLIEETARGLVLGRGGSADLAVRAVLGVAGLSWREAAELIREHPDLLTDVPRPDPEGAPA